MSIEREVKIFKALAHPIRLKIVKKLLLGEVCVCELVEEIGFSQSNLSQHLKILKEAEILVSKKDGLQVKYYIYNKNIIDLIKICEKIVDENINNLT